MRLGAFSLVSVLTFTGLAACSSSDSASETPAGASGAGGTAGSAGASGNGGTAGSGGSAGSAGTAGVGGSSGTAGTGGSGDDFYTGSGGTPMPAGCLIDIPNECNPVDGTGCEAAKGDSCDLSVDDNNKNYFTCWKASNNAAKLGEACNAFDGPYCGPSLLCEGDETGKGVCRHFCCVKSDCDATESCVAIDDSYGTIGTCAAK